MTGRPTAATGLSPTRLPRLNVPGQAGSFIPCRSMDGLLCSFLSVARLFHLGPELEKGLDGAHGPTRGSLLYNTPWKCQGRTQRHGFCYLPGSIWLSLRSWPAYISYVKDLRKGDLCRLLGRGADFVTEEWAAAGEGEAISISLERYPAFDASERQSEGEWESQVGGPDVVYR